MSRYKIMVEAKSFLKQMDIQFFQWRYWDLEFILSKNINVYMQFFFHQNGTFRLDHLLIDILWNIIASLIISVLIISLNFAQI